MDAPNHAAQDAPGRRRIHPADLRAAAAVVGHPDDLVEATENLEDLVLAGGIVVPVVGDADDEAVSDHPGHSNQTVLSMVVPPKRSHES